MKRIINNISLFILTIIILVGQLLLYKPSLETYNVCNLKTCVCGFHTMKFNYTYSTQLKVLSILFIVLTVIIIILSIISMIKNKKIKSDFIFNIIFTIFTILVSVVIINNYRLNTKYGIEVQGQKQVLEHYGENSYLKDTCNGGNEDGN